MGKCHQTRGTFLSFYFGGVGGIVKRTKDEDPQFNQGFNLMKITLV